MRASAERLKQWRKLKMGKYRKREGLFLAEGIRTISQILENGIVEIAALIYCESMSECTLLKSGLPAYAVAPDEFKSLCDTETPQGILALCKIPAESEPEVLAGMKGLILALDTIQDPGNLGTIIRTAAWFGAGGILFGKGCADPFHPKVVRSTAGATGVLPYRQGDLDELLSFFEQRGRTVFLLDAGNQSHTIGHAKIAEHSVLVIGNEANGIHPSLYHTERTALHIPGSGNFAESLNASIAAAIGLYIFTK